MYKEIKNVIDKTQQVQIVQRVADEAFIPFDPANTDYQAYLKWVEEGNTPISSDE